MSDRSSVTGPKSASRSDSDQSTATPAGVVREQAAAKVNLYLHVGPVRPDRLHDLASLFVFVATGDEISVAPAETLSLEISGPFAAPLQDEPTEDNLVMRAAVALRAWMSGREGAAHHGATANRSLSGARIVLDKRLPIAAGIGGGSSDAAAALRALVRLWAVDIGDEDLRALAFDLGADVPACLDAAPVNVSGAGDVLTPGPVLPPLWACLINPLEPMPTGPVFSAFDAEHPTPAAPTHPPLATYDHDGVAQLLASTRNDLQPYACQRSPKVEAIIAMLKTLPGCLGARMSGSGATVFGLFTAPSAAAAGVCAGQEKNYWAASAAVIRPTAARTRPQE